MITFGKLDLDIPFFFQIQGDENGIVLLDTLVAPLVGHKRILGLLDRSERIYSSLNLQGNRPEEHTYGYCCVGIP